MRDTGERKVSECFQTKHALISRLKWFIKSPAAASLSSPSSPAQVDTSIKKRLNPTRNDEKAQKNRKHYLLSAWIFPFYFFFSSWDNNNEIIKNNIANEKDEEFQRASLDFTPKHHPKIPEKIPFLPTSKVVCLASSEDSHRYGSIALMALGLWGERGEH